MNAALWSGGTLLGLAAFFAGAGLRPSSALFVVLGLLCGVLALPISVAVYLTSPLWLHFALGHWFVAALMACLYHGTVAMVLGRTYRRKRSEALALGGAVLALHLILYFLWLEVRLALHR